MSEKESPSKDAAELRRRAEEMTRGDAAQTPEDLAALSGEQIRRTLHELRVHQIELEMQNEELRRAQVELDAARARYFDLYDLAPVGYCTVSEQGLILEANLTAASLLGAERSALVRQRLASLILPEDNDIYYRHSKQLFETGQPRACELRMLEMDGAPFWAHLEATVVEDAGAPVGRVVMSDITGRKRAEEALRESEERYRRIVETAQEGIWVIDAEGKVSYANERVAEMLGYPQAEVVGRPVDDFVAQEHHELSRQKLARSRRGILEQFEFTFLQRSGTPLHALVSTNPLHDQAGHYAGTLSMVSDITKRKRAEEALRKALDDVRTLRGILPICSNCKKIRDDQGYWTQVEDYVRDRTEAEFSHSFCPECMKKLYPEFARDAESAPETERSPQEGHHDQQG
jgi:PAS domain S-box-containing protein